MINDILVTLKFCEWIKKKKKLTHIDIISIVNIKGLKQQIKKCLRNGEVKRAIFNYKTVKNLYTKSKVLVATMFQSDIIHRIKCENCAGTYIGQTSQVLNNRISLHRSDIAKNNRRYASTLHSIDQYQNFRFGNVEIVIEQTEYNKKIMLEMINIWRRIQWHPKTRPRNEELKKKCHLVESLTGFSYLFFYHSLVVWYFYRFYLWITLISKLYILKKERRFGISEIKVRTWKKCHYGTLHILKIVSNVE